MSSFLSGSIPWNSLELLSSTAGSVEDEANCVSIQIITSSFLPGGMQTIHLLLLANVSGSVLVIG